MLEEPSMLEGGGTRVLIVDDEPQARKQVRKYLELVLDTIQLREAADGVEALEVIEEWRPQVVFSDINMPRLDGLELLKKIRSGHPKVQCVIFTGREDLRAPIASLKYGASDYLPKPLNMDELTLTLHRAIERWEKEEQLEKHRLHLELLVEERTAELVGANEQLQEEMEAKRKLEERLRQTQKMEAIGTLAGGVAHDFNNILSSIIGFTGMTMDDLEEGTQARSNLAEVLIAASRAKALVRQILTFSRQSEQRRSLVNLGQLVDETMTMLRSILPTTVEIRLCIDPEPLFVLADSTEICQLLMNLCANAEHAMRPAGGVLEVIVEAAEPSLDFGAAQPGGHKRHARLKVADTGRGMEPAVLERIFEPFFTTKEVGEGTGMGLAVVHGIVQSHGGIITAHSKPGNGTTFKVYFPRADSGAACSTGRAAVSGRHSRIAGGAAARSGRLEPYTARSGQREPNSERILFVDDEEQLVRMGRQMLERLGYTVVGMTSSVMALEAFSADTDKFDLVITDQTMPDMPGDMLAREVLRLRPDIPVILCTGFSHAIPSGLASETGIRQYIMKPVSYRELSEAVRRALAQPTGVNA